MKELLLYIAIFVAVYIIDLLTALLHRKMRPNNFKRVEANVLFSRCLEQKGILKGVGAYLILSSTGAIIFFLAAGIAAKVIFGATIPQILMFAFLFKAMAHVLGIASNLVALRKKDVVPRNNLNQIGAQNEPRRI